MATNHCLTQAGHAMSPAIDRTIDVPIEQYGFRISPFYQHPSTMAKRSLRGPLMRAAWLRRRRWVTEGHDALIRRAVARICHRYGFAPLDLTYSASRDVIAGEPFIWIIVYCIKREPVPGYRLGDWHKVPKHIQTIRFAHGAKYSDFNPGLTD